MNPAAAAHGDTPFKALKPGKLIGFRPHGAHRSHPAEAPDVIDHPHGVGKGVLVGPLNGNAVLRGGDLFPAQAAPDEPWVLIIQRGFGAAQWRRPTARRGLRW